MIMFLRTLLNFACTEGRASHSAVPHHTRSLIRMSPSMRLLFLSQKMAEKHQRVRTLDQKEPPGLEPPFPARPCPVLGRSDKGLTIWAPLPLTPPLHAQMVATRRPRPLF